MVQGLPSGSERDLLQCGVLRHVADPRDLVSLAVASALLAPACCSALGRLLRGTASAAVLLDSAVECNSQRAGTEEWSVDEISRCMHFAWGSRLMAGTAAWCCTRAARAGDAEVAEAVAELFHHYSAGHSTDASTCCVSHLCVAVAWRMGSALDVIAENWHHSDCSSFGHELAVLLNRTRRGTACHDNVLATAAFTLAALQDDAALLWRLTQPPFSLNPRTVELSLPVEIDYSSLTLVLDNPENQNKNNVVMATLGFLCFSSPSKYFCCNNIMFMPEVPEVFTISWAKQSFLKQFKVQTTYLNSL
eukprot:m51a1_g14519 hypothetical protein (305) ;mRNA; f:876646-889012